MLATKENICISSQDVTYLTIRIDMQRAPKSLVNIVMHAVGVGNEAIGVMRKRPDYLRVKLRPRVDAFAAECRGIGRVPPRHRKLCACRMCDVGVVADGVQFSKCF